MESMEQRREPDGEPEEGRMGEILDRLASAFARRLKRDVAPDLEPVAGHAVGTVRAVKRTIDDPAPAGRRGDHA